MLLPPLMSSNEEMEYLDYARELGDAYGSDKRDDAREIFHEEVCARFKASDYEGDFDDYHAFALELFERVWNEEYRADIAA